MEKLETEMKKIREVLKVLGYSDVEANAQLEKLGNILMIEIATEVLSRKGYESKNDIPNKNEIADFLQKQYNEDEIDELIRSVSNDVVSGYLVEILNSVADEKKVLVRKIFDPEL